MSRYYSYETIKDNAKDVTLENGVKHRCIDPDALLDIEPADVRENVRGEWRTTYLDHVAMGERPNILYCSVCNQCIAYPTNYCPNCGAQMMRGEA